MLVKVSTVYRDCHVNKLTIYIYIAHEIKTDSVYLHEYEAITLHMNMSNAKHASTHAGTCIFTRTYIHLHDLRSERSCDWVLNPSHGRPVYSTAAST